MSTIEYNLSETAEDLAALAGEWEEHEQALRAAEAVDYNAGYADGRGSFPIKKGSSPAYLEGFEDGRREWLDDCAN